jgi:hypothetical protein
MYGKTVGVIKVAWTRLERAKSNSVNIRLLSLHRLKQKGILYNAGLDGPSHLQLFATIILLFGKVSYLRIVLSSVSFFLRMSDLRNKI